MGARDSGPFGQLAHADVIRLDEGFKSRHLRCQLDILVSEQSDNLMSNRPRGKWDEAARYDSRSRREDRPATAAAEAIPPSGRGTRWHPREHAEEDRARRRQSDALGLGRNR